jgi:hypothetical protein
MQYCKIERKNENAQTRKSFTLLCLRVFAMLHFDREKERLQLNGVRDSIKPRFLNIVQMCF